MADHPIERDLDNNLMTLMLILWEQLTERERSFLKNYFVRKEFLPPDAKIPSIAQGLLARDGLTQALIAGFIPEDSKLYKIAILLIELAEDFTTAKPISIIDPSLEDAAADYNKFEPIPIFDHSPLDDALQDSTSESNSGNDQLTLVFDTDDFSPEEIAASISMLSDMYREIGGDGLKIDDLFIFSEEEVLVTTN